jgi:hypothetical protein
MLTQEARAQIAKAQAARDDLEKSRSRELAEADAVYIEACRKAGGVSPAAAARLDETRKEIDLRYQLSRAGLDNELADSQAAASHIETPLPKSTDNG